MKYFFTNSLAVLIISLSACSRETSFLAKFEGVHARQSWPIQDLNSELPSDWSSFKYLTFEMNASSAQGFSLKISDREGIRRVRIHPFQGAWVRASIPLVHFQRANVKGHDMAAIGKTPLPGCWIGFTGALGSIENVDSLGVEMNLPIGSPTLEIRNVRLSMAAEDSVLSPLPLIDESGQWIPGEWPGKAHTLDDLRKAWDEEENELQTLATGVSKYRGYEGFQTKATGYFRVEKRDEIWWFVDPEGHLFFSAGSTCINPGGAFSRVEGREYLFEKMIPGEITVSDNRIGKASFSSWNLYRRFGDGWVQKWMDMTIRRMDHWGFNTIANWSDPALGQSRRMPYVATLGRWGMDAGAKMGMPDVYKPGYAEMVDSAAAAQCSPLKDDPFLLGYFVGNEPPWPGRENDLVNAIMDGEETPMKAACKQYLAGGDTPEKRKAFVYETYLKFITTVNKAIKNHDPNHLNLGLRFGGNPSEELIRASASVGFDVFSLNIYGYSASVERLQRIADLTGLPIIIGEFHFGTPERGLAPGLAQVSCQAERGIAYRYYVENAAAHPSVVGTHWFQWWDQPSTGRFDGENYNIGLVDVTDRPYMELLNAAMETHRRIYRIHSGEEKPVTRMALKQ